jgi:hypothetical protein
MTPFPLNPQSWKPEAQAAYQRLCHEGRDIARLVGFIATPQSLDLMVVSLVGAFGTLRQRDVCALLRASRSTISRVVIELRQAGRICEHALPEHATGRPTQWLTLPSAAPPNVELRQQTIALVRDAVLVLAMALPEDGANVGQAQAIEMTKTDDEPAIELSSDTVLAALECITLSPGALPVRTAGLDDRAISTLPPTESTLVAPPTTDRGHRWFDHAHLLVAVFSSGGGPIARALPFDVPASPAHRGRAASGAGCSGQ